MNDLKRGMLKIKIKAYFDNGDLYLDPSFSVLVPYYIDKARHNLETASILLELSGDESIKKKYKVRDDYHGYDWVISCGYYAMFHIATAALGAVGIKAKEHECLIEGLEYYFVYKEKVIDNEDVKKLTEARKLEEKYVNRMWAVKSKRNTAQYKAEAVIARKDAEKTYKDAVEFIDRLSKIINDINR